MYIIPQIFWFALDAEDYSTKDVESSAKGVVQEDCITDTVGVICVDHAGNVASGASSGGIAMKVSKQKLYYYCLLTH